MGMYHLRLFSGEKHTDIRFEAQRDSDAAGAATAVFQSCTDVCDQFELRRSGYWIAGMRSPAKGRALNIEELAARTQELVLQTEETLLQSQSKVAESKHLLERTATAARILRWRQKGPAARSRKAAPTPK
jgi:hypothetical protein